MKNVWVIFFAGLIAGCAMAPSMVADIAKDEHGYLVKNFTLDSMPSRLKVKVAKFEPVTLPFKTVTFEMENTTHRSDTSTGKTSDLTELMKMVVVNAGGGYIQVINDTTNNGIPVWSEFYLSYVNFIDMMSQYVDYGYKRANEIWHWDDIKSLSPDLAHPKEHSTYSMDVVDGRSDITYSCVTDTFQPASTVSPKIPGKALYAHCSFTRDGVVTNRDTMVFLDAYGFYVRLEKDYADVAYTFKIVDVHAE